MTKKSIFIFCVALLLLFCSTASASYIYSFSTDAGTTEINPLSGTWSAEEYYNYDRPSANPLHGYAQDDSAYFWLYEETDTNALSLGVLYGATGSSGNGGDADFILGGLPTGWSWILQDDDADINGSQDTTPTWHWVRHYTDGGVIAGLEDAEWNITWLLTDLVNHSNWYFLTDENGTINALDFSLAEGDTLTVSATNNPVPEPTTIMLLGLGILSFSRLARKKQT